MIQASIDGGHMAGEIARTPMRRLASVDEIVDCIAFMASPMSSYMTGSALVVDGYVLVSPASFFYCPSYLMDTR